MTESVEFESSHAGPTRQLSDSEKQRIIPEEWTGQEQFKNCKPKNIHFLILPAYVRYNDQTPLAPVKGFKEDKKLDLLHFPLCYAQVVSSLRKFTNHNIQVLDPYVEYVSMDEISSWLKEVYRERVLPQPDYLLLGGMSTSWPNIKNLQL
jgi:hypothetical protein